MLLESSIIVYRDDVPEMENLAAIYLRTGSVTFAYYEGEERHRITLADNDLHAFIVRTVKAEERKAARAAAKKEADNAK